MAQPALSLPRQQRVRARYAPLAAFHRAGDYQRADDYKDGVNVVYKRKGLAPDRHWLRAPQQDDGKGKKKTPENDAVKEAPAPSPSGQKKDGKGGPKIAALTQKVALLAAADDFDGIPGPTRYAGSKNPEENANNYWEIHFAQLNYG